jgi:hypothetical protein
MRTAFYCVTDARYFLGAVATINSLRLVGHTEPVFVTDAGLEAPQRELLATNATVIAAPADSPPWLAKAIAPTAHPAEAMVLIDVDMVATRSLTELVEPARAGRVVAQDLELDRSFPEWGEALGGRTPRPGPYVSSGLVALGGSLGPEILRLMDVVTRRVEIQRTFVGSDSLDYPFHTADQDVLNAVLSTSVEPERLLAFDRRLVATSYDELIVADERALRCSHPDGLEPYLIHGVLAVKPWLRATGESVYARLTRRCLTGPDLAIRVPDRMLPSHLRPGPRGFTERAAANVVEAVRWRVGTALHRARERATGSR